MDRNAPPPPNSNRRGFVIIHLPPPDDPSKGKTITAFTLSDSDPSSPQLPINPPTQTTNPPRVIPSCRRSFFSARKVLGSLFAVAFVVVSVYVCLFSEIPFELLRGSEVETEESGERNETKSFLLQLYSKGRGRVLREVEDVKLAGNWIRDDSVQESKKMRVSNLNSVDPSSVNSSAVFPIKGNVYPDGQYYTSIFVGNPPRPYFLDVDTGSDLTWIQCDAPCTSCAKGPHPLYKPAKGKIVPPRDSLCQELQGNQNYCETCNQCDYEIEYADRSSSMGVLAGDDMHLITSNGDREKLNFVFGCAYDQQGQLSASPAKTDGILGLSNSRISLPSQLAQKGIISNIVGHCINSEANGGGFLFLGEDYVPRWGMTWVPTLSGLSNLYHTSVQRVNYGDLQLSGEREGFNKLIQVIFDSGSSYTYFPHDTYNNLINWFKSITNLVRDKSDKTLPVCWKADFPISSVKDVEQFFKPFTLQFAKRWFLVPRTYVIPPEGYLVVTETGNVCLGILDGMEIHQGSSIILGDVSLRGKLVVYDNEQNQIGWVQTDCTKPQKTKGFPFFF